jgi:hypothetical protein
MDEQFRGYNDCLLIEVEKLKNVQYTSLLITIKTRPSVNHDFKSNHAIYFGVTVEGGQDFTEIVRSATEPFYNLIDWMNEQADKHLEK